MNKTRPNILLRYGYSDESEAATSQFRKIDNSHGEFAIDQSNNLKLSIR